MTKEAKLQAAMRILPEWVGYDEEIKTLQQKVENANRQTEKDSGMFPAICLLIVYTHIFFFTRPCFFSLFQKLLLITSQTTLNCKFTCNDLRDILNPTIVRKIL